MKINKILIFLSIFGGFLVIKLTKYILNIDQLLYNSLIEKITERQVIEILNYQQKWEWLSFLLLPILMLIKISIITSIIYIAIFFSKSEITFKSIFNKVVQAEFIFLLVPIFKIIWFYFFQIGYKLEDIQNFFPLSAINITGYEGLEPWYIYPLQTLNLFEVAYIFYLGIQMAKLTKSTPDEGLKMVVFSYVPALLLWMCTIMFLILNYS